MWFKTLLKWIVGYLKSPENLRTLFVTVGQVLFGTSTAKLGAAWDLLWTLAQDAERAFGAGQGDAKYASVLSRFKALLPDVETRVMDFILHALLPGAVAAVAPGVGATVSTTPMNTTAAPLNTTLPTLPPTAAP
jgi:hypothetical protein